MCTDIKKNVTLKLVFKLCVFRSTHKYKIRYKKCMFRIRFHKKAIGIY